MNKVSSGTVGEGTYHQDNKNKKSLVCISFPFVYLINIVIIKTN